VLLAMEVMEFGAGGKRLGELEMMVEEGE